MSGGTRVMTGSFVGTGANIDIDSVGFKPRSVKIVNRTGLARLYWNEAMPDASGDKTITDGTQSFITTLGVTPRASGFRVGADTDVNVASELCYWEAHE